MSMKRRNIFFRIWCRIANPILRKLKTDIEYPYDYPDLMGDSSYKKKEGEKDD